MLVLSRRVDQKICFPGLGISVQVLGVKGSSIKLGVDAPLEVRVIREELAEEGQLQKEQVIRLPQASRHELRNQLNLINLALFMFKQQVETGAFEDADETFERIIAHLQRLAHGESESGADDNAEIPSAKRESLRALLVEDNPNEREMLAGFLRMQGYEVTTAADGLEALDCLENGESPDVVLIDMRMPRQDGPTTIRKIRGDERFDRTKVFAISGCEPGEVGIDTSRDRINRWFQKPLDPRSLVDALVVDESQGLPTAV